MILESKLHHEIGAPRELAAQFATGCAGEAPKNEAASLVCADVGHPDGGAVFPEGLAVRA